MKFKKTKKSNHKPKVLIHGPAGVGKTSLIKTAPKPLIISCEAGLLSLPDGIPYEEIKKIKRIYKILDFLKTKKAKEQFETICLDSLSDISETLLSQLLKKEEALENRWWPYQKLAEGLIDIIKQFRSLHDYNVYFTAKTEQIKDEYGIMMFRPAMPGNVLTTQIPYLLDEIFAMRIFEDDETEEKIRFLQCQPSHKYEAKDRSGKLKNKEKPDLSHIFNKIGGNRKKKK